MSGGLGIQGSDDNLLRSPQCNDRVIEASHATGWKYDRLGVLKEAILCQTTVVNMVGLLRKTGHEADVRDAVFDKLSDAFRRLNLLTPFDVHRNENAEFAVDHLIDSAGDKEQQV